jgi:mRNA interferase MazF
MASNEPTPLARPQEGEVWLVSFGAGRIGEPTKNRPVLVLSSAELLTGSVHDLVIVLPISASMPPTISRPVIGVEAGLEQESAVICRAIRAISPTRMLRRLGTAPTESLEQCRSVLADLLGFCLPVTKVLADDLMDKRDART